MENIAGKKLLMSKVHLHLNLRNIKGEPKCRHLQTRITEDVGEADQEEGLGGTKDLEV